MDPISSLSVAAAVIQFVDFGSRLLSNSLQIYRSPSGQTAAVVSLSDISNDLAQLAEEVARHLSLPRHGKTSIFQSQLLKMCGDCKELNKELQASVHRIRAKRVKDRSDDDGIVQTEEGLCLLAALRGILAEPKIKQMTERMKDVRKQMMMAMLACLWENAKNSQEREIEFSSQLDDLIKTMNGLPYTKQRPLGKELIAMTGPDSEVRRELIKVLWDPNWNSTTALSMPSRENFMAQESADAFYKAIHMSLGFAAIQSRKDAVPEAYHSTYKWIFSDLPREINGVRMWSSFPTWLEANSEEIFWITGKPGSGKSTLFKYTVTHNLSQTLLGRWVADKDLLLATFYSWNAGSDLQKSCEGLMRTLLHQALLSYPHLTSCLAPRRWALLNILRNSHIEFPEWQPEELEQSLHALLAECGKDLRLALFVDGLDEFEVPPAQILDFIHKINSFPGVKICVASRAWAEFEDSFGQSPMLQMHNLTHRDIEIFVAGRFEANKGFQSLQGVSASEADELFQDVIRKAQGLFLWVSLVVGALLEGLTDGDRFSDLQDTVMGLPSDISELYSHIWSGIRPRNLRRSSELLQLFHAAISPMTYTTLWLADEMKSLSFDQSAMSPRVTKETKALMKRRLISQTRGILEILPDNTVSFLHKSARDWVSQTTIWDNIRSGSPEFDPYPPLLQANTIRLISAPGENGAISSSLANRQAFCHDVLEILYYASEMDYATADMGKLLRALDLVEQRAVGVGNALNAVDKTGGYVTGFRGTHSETRPVLVGGLPPPNTFIGLTAQFSITPYMLAKLSRNNGFLYLPSDEGYYSVLENAVFGHQCLPVKPIITKGSHMDISRRIETVELLLDRGASSRCDMLRKAQRTRASRASEGCMSAETEYLDQVILVLKRSRRQNPFKQWFKCFS
ncbi:hypothetical protein B0J14DRAFT_218079 [Halenospora varia]|nr:hypothetical protein B0J14DRAFT_218079 [Halenospora varia]